MSKKQKDNNQELQQAANQNRDESQATVTKAADESLSFEELKQRVTEDDNVPVAALTLRRILGGDILSADVVRRQVWLCLLIAFFVTFYVAFRYQCQQDMIDIAQLESELVDAKYKALSSSSSLTERCRESKVLEMLRQHQDSTLSASSQPPYKIYIPEN